MFYANYLARRPMATVRMISSLVTRVVVGYGTGVEKCQQQQQQHQQQYQPRRQFGDAANNSNNTGSKTVESRDGNRKKCTSSSPSLLAEIVQQIQARGPISVADYMKLALTHPVHGFYMKQDVFGRQGHFITSPEVSQLFGEMLGVWIVYEWTRRGKPTPLRIVEVGPGRGTLTLDLSRVFHQLKLKPEQLSFSLVEVSPFLKLVQQATVCHNLEKTRANIAEYMEKGLYTSKTAYGQQITWYRSLDQLPPPEDKHECDGFTVFVANEYFDALPIYKFHRRHHRWHELLVGQEVGGKLKWTISPGDTPASKVFLDPNVTGDHYEASPESIIHLEKMVDLIDAGGKGAILICDYGFDSDCQEVFDRDTLRAYRGHKQVDLFANPGDADLTADVDFATLKKGLDRDVTVFGTVTQAAFLRQMGIELRLEKLLESTNPKLHDHLRGNVKMLLEDMGERFRFMAIFNGHEDTVPAGFFDEAAAAGDENEQDG